ncbi:MAG TPA: glucose-6-phosphate dehydrogenase assembly protein OpcA [Pyrinomonadaceae bacterium]|jgi:glucose-6-phosphate dehydrogenase assembly protein OpcA
METQTHGSAVSVSTTRGIDVGRIEKELAMMWQQASHEEGLDESGVVRACALNLVVYTTVQDDRARIEEMLEEVNEQHPGRALVLVADREASAPSLEAYVSSRCRMLGASKRQVCGEQVTIEAGGPTVETAASAIIPLLVPDVPVFLWWKDIPHYEDKLFERMARMADRVLIDSAAFDHPHEDLLRLADIVRSLGRDARISDLNWGRLTSWRTLLASFWDVAEYRAHLERIDGVRIEYDPPDAAPAEIAPKALLAAGWLASRLNWTLEEGSVSKEGDTTRYTFKDSQARPVIVEMCALHDEKGGDGMLASLVLTEETDRASFSVALSRDGNRLETKATIDGTHTVGRVLAYEQKSEGQRLSRELSLLARDRIYEQTLMVAAQLTEAVK